MLSPYQVQFQRPKWTRPRLFASFSTRLSIAETSCPIRTSSLGLRAEASHSNEVTR
jgi:hypothetical protein